MSVCVWFSTAALGRPTTDPFEARRAGAWLSNTKSIGAKKVVRENIQFGRKYGMCVCNGVVPGLREHIQNGRWACKKERHESRGTLNNPLTTSKWVVIQYDLSAEVEK